MIVAARCTLRVEFRSRARGRRCLPKSVFVWRAVTTPVCLSSHDSVAYTPFRVSGAYKIDVLVCSVLIASFVSP